MLRKFVCAAAVMAIAVGFAVAEELRGRITKVEGNKVTLVRKKNEVKELETAPV